MSIKYKFALLFITIFFLSVNAFAKNQFEGYNVIVSAPKDHRKATCAIRYAPRNNDLIIADLTPSTPMNLKGCGGSGANLVQSGSTATLKASPTDGKWCFEGEDEMYRISFRGDQHKRQVSYNWIANQPERERGFFNIRDFGAVGDGRTDDTKAFESALAYVAANNGGTLTVPNGDYIISDSLTLPSGLVLRGTNGLQSGASTNNLKQQNASRITLRGRNKALFQVGECTEKIAFEDIELNAESGQNTYGVEAFGAWTSSQGFSFNRVVFNNFFRGVYVHGLPQTKLNWQFDYVKIKESRFIYNKDAGVYCNTRNTDWKIEGTLFINPGVTPTQKANSMHFERIGMVTILDTFGGGFANRLGGTFINILDSGPIGIINSQTENMTNSLVYNEVENPYAGDYSYPITVFNSVFENPIIFKARRTFVSTGTLYGSQTFQADERVRVYSTGDRFCYDGYTIGCRGATNKNFDKATVVFMTGQPAEKNIPEKPTYFGTDVQFGKTVQMPIFRFNVLPKNKPNGSMVYCEDCRRDTTPCRGGGSGSPAMVVNGSWSCL